jgi:hypothetical protein
LSSSKRSGSTCGSRSTTPGQTRPITNRAPATRQTLPSLSARGRWRASQPGRPECRPDATVRSAPGSVEPRAAIVDAELTYGRLPASAPVGDCDTPDAKLATRPLKIWPGATLNVIKTGSPMFMLPRVFSGRFATTQPASVSMIVATVCPADAYCPGARTVFVTIPSIGALTSVSLRSIRARSFPHACECCF